MKVLVVEDSENSRVLLEEFFHSQGADVFTAQNGQEALQLVAAQIPDLVISDILMPVMDGFEFCRQLKCQEPTAEIPFIFYTATYTEEKDRQLAMSLGADRFVIKPVTSEQLAKIIEEVLADSQTPGKKTISDEDFTAEHGSVLSAQLQKKISELEMEHQLLNSKERELRLVTDAIPTLVSHIDSNACYCYVNQAYEVWHGTSRAEIIGRKIRDVVGEQVWEGIRTPVEQALKGKSVEYESELEFLNGEKKHIHAKYVPIFTPAGEPDGFIALVNDITELVKEQVEKQRLYEQLLQAQKMESIGHLVGGIAHDFNNMLASMIGFTELSIEQLNSVGKENGYLKEVLETGKKARDLVSQMLAFGRGGHQGVKHVRLHAAVESTLRLIRKLIPTSIDIQVEYAEQDRAISINPVQLQQVLMNLCINSRDAMNGKGTISIKTAEQPLNMVICDSCGMTYSGIFNVISVQDTGRGLSTDTQRKMFKPFFSTKQIGEGSGMGLSVVHGVLHDAGGHIKVESQAGRGTTLHLYFPQIDADEVDDPSDVSMEINPGELKKQGRILVLDDEQSIGLYLEILLSNAGHEVRVFSNPLQAVAHLKESGCLYDLILTDYTMPEMNGIEFAGQVRSICDNNIPIVLCTGFSESINSDTAHMHGVDTYLMKPFASAQILDDIQQLLLKNR